MVLNMTVTENEIKEILETTPSTGTSSVMANLRTYISNISTAIASTPSYGNLAGNLDNIALSKATPKNGIITFSFKLDGISISIAYREE